MIELRVLVDGLVAQHAPPMYNPALGTFSSRGRAAVTIETLRKILQGVLGEKYDSRMLSVEGKHSGVYIYVPRLSHQWWPGAARANPTLEGDVKDELNHIVTELKKDLEA